ncbi:MAG: PfkB family carbohydrate kinase, partial [Geminicoccaceae bacterium]
MLLVFGSINVDLLFEVEALARPGETVLCPSYALAPGGKGANQATAAARAGAAVRMIGHVGDDGFGRLARQALAAAGVDCAGVATSGKATGIAVIGVDRAAENQIMVASGANLDTSAGQIAAADLAPGVTLLCQNEVRPEATFALLERASARGARTIPLAELFTDPSLHRRQEHTIRPGEVLTHVNVPDAALQRRGTYVKAMDRKAWSFALVSVAAAARPRDGTLRDTRIVLGGVAPVPWRVEAAEREIDGHPYSDAVALRAADVL